MDRITGTVLSVAPHDATLDFVSVRCSYEGGLLLLEALAPTKLFEEGEEVTVEFQQADPTGPAFYKREL